MIRAATSHDLVAIAEIEQNEPMGSQWSLAQLSAELSNPKAVFVVAEVNDSCAGYALAWRVLDEVEIMTIAVAESYRQQGIGRALLEFLLRPPEVRTAFLELRESNQAARALYRSTGFEKTGTRRNYYRNGEHAILMRKECP